MVTLSKAGVGMHLDASQSEDNNLRAHDYKAFLWRYEKSYETRLSRRLTHHGNGPMFIDVYRCNVAKGDCQGDLLGLGIRVKQMRVVESENAARLMRDLPSLCDLFGFSATSSVRRACRPRRRALKFHRHQVNVLWS